LGIWASNLGHQGNSGLTELFKHEVCKPAVRVVKASPRLFVKDSEFDKEFAEVAAWLKAEGGGFSRKEACRRLHVSVTRIAQLTATGELEFKKLHNLVIISRRSLESFERRREGFPDRDHALSTGRPATAKTDWEDVFLATLESTGSVMDAVRASGVSRQTAYARRAKDGAFAAAWREALRFV
jgi:hypothetical protein